MKTNTSVRIVIVDAMQSMQQVLSMLASYKHLDLISNRTLNTYPAQSANFLLIVTIIKTKQSQLKGNYRHTCTD